MTKRTIAERLRAASQKGVARADRNLVRQANDLLDVASAAKQMSTLPLEVQMILGVVMIHSENPLEASIGRYVMAAAARQKAVEEIARRSR